MKGERFLKVRATRLWKRSWSRFDRLGTLRRQINLGTETGHKAYTNHWLYRYTNRVHQGPDRIIYCTIPIPPSFFSTLIDFYATPEISSLALCSTAAMRPGTLFACIWAPIISAKGSFEGNPVT